MADLFFESAKQEIKNNFEIGEKIEEEIIDNIQTQAERLFENENIEQTLLQIQAVPIQLEKDELAKKSFEIFQSQNINESGLGYFYKIWSFLIRNNSNQVLEFLSTNKEYFNLLMKNLKYYSVSNLVAQLLICQDKTKQYQYKEFKNEIFHQIIEKLIQNKQNEELYDGMSILVQEVLNNSKQSYYQYFQDFKVLVNYLTSENVLSRFFNILFQNQEQTFKNALKYLQLIFERINSERDDNQNNRYSETNSDSSMKFQISIFFTNIVRLFSRIEQIVQYSTITRINYLAFLMELMKCLQINHGQINYPKILQILLSVFKNENKSKGMYKVKLSKLVIFVANKCQKANIQTIINSEENFQHELFSTIRSLNIQNSRQYNKNENVAFECQILFQLDKKLENLVENTSKITSKNLKRVKKNYETKIANYGKPTKSFALEEQGFFNFNESFENLRLNSNRQSSGQQNLVGKNNISIPILNLPQQLKKPKQGSQRKSQRKGDQKCQSQQLKQNEKLVEKEQIKEKLIETKVEKGINIKYYVRHLQLVS